MEDRFDVLGIDIFAGKRRVNLLQMPLRTSPAILGPGRCGSRATPGSPGAADAALSAHLIPMSIIINTVREHFEHGYSISCWCPNPEPRVIRSAQREQLNFQCGARCGFG
jgi:hypothetical protein